MNCYQKFYTNQIHSSSLLCQLATMWKSQVLCDAIIKSGSINIKAHRVVLVAACPMLQSMENAAVGSHLEVRLASDIKQESINTFLQYLYEGFMLLTEENCKDVEKIGRLLQVDSVIKCCADFFKCLSSKTGLVDLNEQYRYTNYQDVEFKHVRSSHIQKTLQEKSLKRGIDVVRPASPSSKRHRYHNADDTFSMSQSYNVTDPWERVPRAGAPSHRQSSSQPGVIDVVEDSLELVQTDPPGSTNSATNRQANNKSVSISVSSQLNRDSNVQVVNVPDANKKQNDQSNKQSQQHNNQNQSVASPLTALCEMSSPNNDSPLHRAPDITAGTLKKQMPSPMHSHSAITHSMPSPHSIDSSFPSPQSYDTSQQSSHQSRPVPVAKPFAAGSASQTGPLFSMMATSSSMPSPSSLRRSESQSSTGSKDTDRPAVDTGQTTGSVASPSESKVNEENIADLNIVKIESDDSNTGGLDMYVDTNEDGIVKLTRNTDDDLDDTSATDQSYDWTRERMEGGLEGNQTWFAGQTQAFTPGSSDVYFMAEGFPSTVHGRESHYEQTPSMLGFQFKDSSKPHRITDGALQKTCIVCKNHDRRIVTKSMGKGRINRTYFSCEACGVGLCWTPERKCFVEFHEWLVHNKYRNLQWEMPSVDMMSKKKGRKSSYDY